jgi:hypothetical protein
MRVAAVVDCIPHQVVREPARASAPTQSFPVALKLAFLARLPLSFLPEPRRTSLIFPLLTPKGHLVQVQTAAPVRPLNAPARSAGRTKHQASTGLGSAWPISEDQPTRRKPRQERMFRCPPQSEHRTQSRHLMWMDGSHRTATPAVHPPSWLSTWAGGVK